MWGRWKKLSGSCNSEHNNTLSRTPLKYTFNCASPWNVNALPFHGYLIQTIFLTGSLRLNEDESTPQVQGEEFSRSYFEHFNCIQGEFQTTARCMDLLSLGKGTVSIATSFLILPSERCRQCYASKVPFEIIGVTRPDIKRHTLKIT